MAGQHLRCRAQPAETISELSTIANTVASAAARVPVLVHIGAGRTLVTGLMRGSGASDKALDLGEQITESPHEGRQSKVRPRCPPHLSAETLAAAPREPLRLRQMLTSAQGPTSPHGH